MELPQGRSPARSGTSVFLRRGALGQGNQKLERSNHAVIVLNPVELGAHILKGVARERGYFLWGP